MQRLRGPEGLSSLDFGLVWFESLSRLNINPIKNIIFHVGKVDNVRGLALEIGCNFGSLPTDYLGLPLNNNSIRCGMELKKGLVRGSLCGRGLTFLKEEDLHS